MNKKQILWTSIGAAALIALIIGAVFLWKGFSAEPNEDLKSFTFTVIDGEGQSTEYKIETEKGTLAEALVEAELVEYQEDGYYTTIAGITADWDKDKSYWWFTENGMDMTRGINEQPIQTYDRYEATYKVSE